MFRRITPSSQWQAQPPITDAELEPMVKSFDISNEKHSSTRYLATVTYVFNPSAVRTALRKSGTQFSESKAKPVLVVALSGVGVGAGVVVGQSMVGAIAARALGTRRSAASATIKTGQRLQRFRRRRTGRW